MGPKKRWNITKDVCVLMYFLYLPFEKRLKRLLGFSFLFFLWKTSGVIALTMSGQFLL